MATETINSVEKCKNLIDIQTNFVLQGGAGSGKTEALKDLLIYISQTQPNAKVMCITHTNNAVDEIKQRTNNIFSVSTIHAFLHDLIKIYTKNIKTVIHNLYTVVLVERALIQEGENEKEYNEKEHKKYKKVYEKYAKNLYDIKGESASKVTGKREYDKDPERYNTELNQKIDHLNQHIIDKISNMDYSKIRYNQTKFNSLTDVSYGHDGLLNIAHLLFNEYPLLGKIITDKFDYIFIDEFQDSNPNIIKDFINISIQADSQNKLCIGLFGDSMQSIFIEGVGSVKEYVEKGQLIAVPKADNYRCAYEIVDFINTLRLDTIQQKVALAKIGNDKFESESNRHGTVEILYSICEKRPNSYSSDEDKEMHINHIDYLINEAKKQGSDAKILLLTNKAIAQKEGFATLYKIFDDRYSEVSEEIEKYLEKIQALDICEICYDYNGKKYNNVINKVKLSGYSIKSIVDKQSLKTTIEKLTINDKFSLKEAVEFAINKNLIKQTETHKKLKEYNEQFLKEQGEDSQYQKFKGLYEDKKNTFIRMKNDFTFSSEEEFEDYEKVYKKERFINALIDGTLKFSEVLNYYKYLNEQAGYITMHKTKGSSIDSVIVVMEEYYWQRYDFSSLYVQDGGVNEKRKEDSQKLIYVACSRAKKHLTLVKVITKEEEKAFKERFNLAKEISCHQDLPD